MQICRGSQLEHTILFPVPGAGGSCCLPCKSRLPISPLLSFGEASVPDEAFFGTLTAGLEGEGEGEGEGVLPKSRII